MNGLRLADPVAPVHGLQVGLGVPVRVVQYYCICGLQVNTETARSRAEEEAIQRTRGSVVLLDALLPQFVGRGAVDADVAVAPAREWSHDDAIDAK